MKNKLKSFFKKVKFIYYCNIIENINKEEILKKYLEDKVFRDNMGYICTVKEGQLYYSKDNGSIWQPAVDTWSVVEYPQGKFHIAYATKISYYPEHSVINDNDGTAKNSKIKSSPPLADYHGDGGGSTF